MEARGLAHTWMIGWIIAPLLLLHATPASYGQGACCLFPEGCIITTGPECVAQGGVFNGNGTSCFDGSCVPRGACCFTNGCELRTEQDCTASGFDYLGDGVTCAASGCSVVNEPETGACCLTGGVCDLRTEAECAAVQGFFEGVGTTCADASCDTPQGACCIEGVCSIQRRGDCVVGGGKYFGDGTVCDEDLVLDCQQRDEVGPCCLPSGECVDTLTRGECEDQPGATFEDDFGDCNDFSCASPAAPEPTVPCCVDGNCELLTVSDCASANGVVQDGDSCEEVVCSSDFDTFCCLDDDCVMVESAVLCGELGGETAVCCELCEGDDCPLAEAGEFETIDGNAATCFAASNAAVIATLVGVWRTSPRRRRQARRETDL